MQVSISGLQLFSALDIGDSIRKSISIKFNQKYSGITILIACVSRKHSFTFLRNGKCIFTFCNYGYFVEAVIVVLAFLCCASIKRVNEIIIILANLASSEILLHIIEIHPESSIVSCRPSQLLLELGCPFIR